MYYYPPNYGTAYTQQQSGLKGHPVSSIEEVRAAQVDFDGSLFVYPDIANQKIYTKQINLDGTAALRVYSLVKDAPPAPAYVTKEELESIVQNLKEEFSHGRQQTKQSATTGSNNPAISF